MRKVGRPELPPDERRDVRYTVLLNRIDASRFDRAIERLGKVTAAEWFRKQARRLAAGVK